MLETATFDIKLVIENTHEIQIAWLVNSQVFLPWPPKVLVEAQNVLSIGYRIFIEGWDDCMRSGSNFMDVSLYTESLYPCLADFSL